MENISVLSNKEEGLINLPPGFRFHQTNEELLTYYLYKKTNNANIYLSGCACNYGAFEKRAPALLDKLTQAFLLAPFFVLLEVFQSLLYEPYPGFHTRVKAKMGADQGMAGQERKETFSTSARYHYILCSFVFNLVFTVWFGALCNVYQYKRAFLLLTTLYSNI